MKLRSHLPTMNSSCVHLFNNPSKEDKIKAVLLTKNVERLHHSPPDAIIPDSCSSFVRPVCSKFRLFSSLFLLVLSHSVSLTLSIAILMFPTLPFISITTSSRRICGLHLQRSELELIYHAEILRLMRIAHTNIWMLCCFCHANTNTYRALNSYPLNVWTPLTILLLCIIIINHHYSYGRIHWFCCFHASTLHFIFPQATQRVV